MFTGIVEELGRIRSFDGSRLRIGATRVLGDVRTGDSIAVNGVCLTVTSLADGGFCADVMRETLDRTTLGALHPGDPVNLERPVTASSRLGGHIVQGHVDGVGTIRERHQEGNGTVLTIETPPEVLRYCIVKGSITVDGVSLTIVQVQADRFSVMLIPHTQAMTTLGFKKVGDAVNLEADMIAKHVAKSEPGSVMRMPPTVATNTSLSNMRTFAVRSVTGSPGRTRCKDPPR